MFVVYKEVKVSAAHHLPSHEKCGAVHGHNYKIEVWCQSEMLLHGMVVDFGEIKRVCMEYDHKNLNEFHDVPTAETLARALFDKIKNCLKVRVWETDSSYAEYYQPPTDRALLKGE